MFGKAETRCRFLSSGTVNKCTSQVSIFGDEDKEKICKTVDTSEKCSTKVSTYVCAEIRHVMWSPFCVQTHFFNLNLISAQEEEDEQCNSDEAVSPGFAEAYAANEESSSSQGFSNPIDINAKVK
jgi:hypothetical protein